MRRAEGRAATIGERAVRRAPLAWLRVRRVRLRARAGRSRWLAGGLALVGLLGSLAAASASTARAAEPESASAPRRVISLNPSLTAIVLRLGRADTLVGVDDYSARVLPAVADRPTVGGLFDPSLEAVVALRPDRVLVVAGVDQQSFAERLERLGLAVDVYPNERLDEVLENVERLGRLLDRRETARDRIQAIRATRRAVATAAAGRPRPATLAVVDRSPLYVVGAETFLDEMLAAVGARNLGRSLGPGYPRGSLEWLIASGPELLLDMTPDGDGAAAFWSRWPSLPAVRTGRVIGVEASRVSMPGPDLDLALRELAGLVHGDEIQAEIDAALPRARAELRAETPAGEDAP